LRLRGFFSKAIIHSDPPSTKNAAKIKPGFIGLRGRKKFIPESKKGKSDPEYEKNTDARKLFYALKRLGQNQIIF